MKNKHIALLLLAVTLLILFIIFSYNNALERIVAETCTHGSICPMYGTIDLQKKISYSLVILLGIVAGFFFFKKDPAPETTIISKIIQKEIQKERPAEKPIDLSKLDEEEKKIVQLLQAHEGSMYQSDIVKETTWTKVTVTRALDKLEGKKIVGRQRRGLTNIVILQ